MLFVPLYLLTAFKLCEGDIAKHRQRYFHRSYSRIPWIRSQGPLFRLDTQGVYRHGSYSRNSNEILRTNFRFFFVYYFRTKDSGDRLIDSTSTKKDQMGDREELLLRKAITNRRSQFLYLSPFVVRFVTKDSTRSEIIINNKNTSRLLLQRNASFSAPRIFLRLKRGKWSDPSIYNTCPLPSNNKNGYTYASRDLFNEMDRYS